MPGSDIILCTDGQASDKSEHFYDLAIEYAKNTQTRINVLTFPDCDSGLNLLGKLASETGGKLSRSEQIELQFEEIVEKSFTETKSPVNKFTDLALISAQKNLIFFESNSSQIQRKVQATEDCCMFEFTLKSAPTDLFKQFFFQLQLFNDQFMRVLNFSIEYDGSAKGGDVCINKSLVHVFVGQKLARNILSKDYVEGERIMNKYRKSDDVRPIPKANQDLLDIFTTKNTRLSDQKAELVYSFTNMNSALSLIDS